MRFVTLYSGSSGNCSLVYTDSTVLLIDMGVSCRRVVTALKTFGIAPDRLSGILLTHEHSDHISGLEVFLRKYDVPIYGTWETMTYLQERGLVPYSQRTVYVDEDGFEVGDIYVTPFATSHDSASCRGYRLENGDASLAVATDIGTMTDTVYGYLRGCSAVALESNYDEFMLRNGPYSPELKRRISSVRGHLSNDDCAKTVARLAADGTRKFMLMHISAENNTPQNAVIRCCGELENRGLDGLGCTVCAAPRYEMSEVWEIN